MAKIDYKNRSVLLTYGYTTDGQKDVELYFDRFDKVLYFTDLNGGLFSPDGTAYTPTPIPDENYITNVLIDLTPIENGDAYDSPYGRIYINFFNKVTESSMIVDNFTVTTLTGLQNPLGVWNSFDPSTSGYQVVVALPYGFIDTLEPNIVYCVVENEAGDITQLQSQIGYRLTYRRFENYEALCAFSSGGYGGGDTLLDGEVAYSQVSGGVFTIDGTQVINDVPTLYYVKPYSYVTVIGNEPFTEAGYYVQSDTAVTGGLLGQFVGDYCGSFTLFDATLNNGQPFESAEALCEAYSTEGINGTLYFQDTSHLYSDFGVTQLDNGYIAFVDAEVTYVMYIENGVQTTTTPLDEVCV